MADVLIRSFSKILSLLVGPNNVAIDNWTFQMFYKVTPMLLGACVILVCTRKGLFNRNALRLNFDWGQIPETVRIIQIRGNGPTLPILSSSLQSVEKESYQSKIINIIEFEKKHPTFFYQILCMVLDL